MAHLLKSTDVIGRNYFIWQAKKINDLTEAESIVQEVFLDIWQRRATLNIQKALDGYLVVAVKYRIINYMAKLDRKSRYQSYVHDKQTDADCSTENWLSFEELRTWLELNVAKLPERCRVVYQYREEGLSHKEIAAQMHISEKTVENHIGNALKVLRNELAHFLPFLF